jgi:hypothetical protein
MWLNIFIIIASAFIGIYSEWYWGIALFVVSIFIIYKPSDNSSARAVANESLKISENQSEFGSSSLSIDVVGESNYQDVLIAIAGNHGDSPPEGVVIASISPEPTNKYDNLAIRVDINGGTVGYLSREDARSYRKLFSNNLNTQCNAEIIGGYVMRNGERAMYGVRLDMKLNM